MKPKQKRLLDWLLPVIVLVGLTIPFWVSDLDVSMMGGFFTPGVGWEHGWDQPWDALYRYGVIPAYIVGAGALAVFLLSFRLGKFRTVRLAALFLVLTLALGPGLVVNSVFKQNWGRPRPRDLIDFGGDRNYAEPFVKNRPENGNSFASGHAASAFYLLVPYFLVRRRSRGWACLFLTLGLGYGSVMGLARMLQGAHFPSDVLWALGFVYLSGLAVFYSLRLERDLNSPEAAGDRLD